MNFKTKKEKFFFTPHMEEFYWITIPLVLLFLLSLGAFIATSFWKVDLKSAEVFAQGMKHTGMLYWTQYYSASGNTELIAILIILIMVIVETLYFYKRSRKVYTTIWEGWTLKMIYIIIGVIWLAFNIYQAISMNWTDKGFGKGFDNEVMGSFKYKQVGKCIGIVIQTSILFISCWYLHFKMTKRKDFWYQQYWLDATKGIVFFAFTYIIVAVMKWLFGRVYYYNYDFGNLYVQLKMDHPQQWLNYQNHIKEVINTGKDIPGISHDYIKNAYGFGPHYDQNSPDPTPWWKPNGVFTRPKDTPQLPTPINYAFPSGHVNATYCVATVFYLLINPKKGRKMNWWKRVLLVWYIVHILSMNFAVVVMRWHWFSDTSFTNMLAVMSFPLMIVIVNACYKSILGDYHRHQMKKYGYIKHKSSITY